MNSLELSERKKVVIKNTVIWYFIIRRKYDRSTHFAWFYVKMIHLSHELSLYRWFHCGITPRAIWVRSPLYSIPCCLAVHDSMVKARLHPKSDGNGRHLIYSSREPVVSKTYPWRLWCSLLLYPQSICSPISTKTQWSNHSKMKMKLICSIFPKAGTQRSIIQPMSGAVPHDAAAFCGSTTPTTMAKAHLALGTTYLWPRLWRWTSGWNTHRSRLPDYEKSITKKHQQHVKNFKHENGTLFLRLFLFTV
jgi:hypothetical protein